MAVSGHAGTDTMRIAIRADASRDVGVGHVMRCLALAEALRQQHAEVVFLCQSLKGHMQALIQDSGFACQMLPVTPDWKEDAGNARAVLQHSSWDWLVVDHYALDANWQRLLRHHAKRVMVIDDLANRTHDCELLLDQNLYADPGTRYEALVPCNTVQLLGPEYALLNPGFARLREARKPLDGKIRHVLVCFGGADAPNASLRVLTYLLPAFPDIFFEVVLGAANPHRFSLEALCQGYSNVSLNIAVSDMPERMARADLFIGAGGSMTWERAALGLPGVILSIADNQRPLAQILAQLGEGYDLGAVEVFKPDELIAVLKHLLDSPEELRLMGQSLSLRCDGRGAERVAERLFAVQTEA